VNYWKTAEYAAALERGVMLSRGLRLRAAAWAFAAENTVFSMGGRGLRALSGELTTSIQEDFLRSGATLGILHGASHVAGGLFAGAVRGLRGTATPLNGAWRAGQVMTSQVGVYGGLVAEHALLSSESHDPWMAGLNGYLNLTAGLWVGRMALNTLWRGFDAKHQALTARLHELSQVRGGGDGKTWVKSFMNTIRNIFPSVVVTDTGLMMMSSAAPSSPPPAPRTQSGTNRRPPRAKTLPLRKMGYEPLAASLGLKVDGLLGLAYAGSKPRSRDASQAAAIPELLFGNPRTVDNISREILWIRLHRIEAAYPRLCKYLVSHHRPVRIMALEALLDIRPQGVEYPELFDLLDPYRGSTKKLSAEEIREISLILNAIRELNVPANAFRSKFDSHIATWQAPNVPWEIRAQADMLAIREANEFHPRLFHFRIPENDEAGQLHALRLLHTVPGHFLRVASEYTDFVAGCLQAESPSLRREAAPALRHYIGVPEAMHLLGKRIHDPDPEVRLAAATQLMELSATQGEAAAVLNVSFGETFNGFLIPRASLYKQNPQMQLITAQALMASGRGEDALPIYQQMLHGDSATVRLQAVDSLLQGLDKTSRSAGSVVRRLQQNGNPLETLLLDSEPDVRWTAGLIKARTDTGWRASIVREVALAASRGG
jgi:hypothetical protein